MMKKMFKNNAIAFKGKKLVRKPERREKERRNLLNPFTAKTSQYALVLQVQKLWQPSS